MAMGILMTGFTLFGMLALVIASVSTDDGVEVTELLDQTTDSSDVESYKKAA